MNKKLHIGLKALFMVTVLLFLASCHSVVVQVEDIPANTPSGDPIYIAGNFNNWDPGNEQYRLELIDDSIYTIVLPKGFGAIEYKFTRGDWRTVEKDVCGYEVGNRRFVLGEGDTVYAVIDSWNDQDPLNCGQVTIMVKNVDAKTPEDAQLAVAGNFNSWIPDTDSYMTKDSLGSYYFTLDRPEGISEIEYKITRGDMGSVEMDAYGNEIPVRMLRFGVTDTVQVIVENWKDLLPRRSNNVVIICQSIPSRTFPDEPIYLVSNINGWNPSDQNYILWKNKQGDLEISIPRQKRDMYFKFTRGDWSSVEVDKFGYEIENRSLNFSEQDTLYVEIGNWKDRSDISDHEITIILDEVPQTTPPDAEIYIGGNMNRWRAGNDDYIMTKSPDGIYSINLQREWGRLEFKFTRGSWDEKEIGVLGSEMPNRKFEYKDIDTLRLQVENWSDLPVIEADGLTLILRDLPSNTPEDADFYVPTNFNGWDPGSNKWRMEQNADGDYCYFVPERNQLFEFKITRGNWGNVEVNRFGEEIPNRAVYFGFTDTLYIDIPKWRDFGGKY